MKLNFLKLKKNKIPSLKSLKPQIFDTNFFWFTSLATSFLILLILASVGLKLFYSQYFETYKQAKSTENFENLININKLKGAIEKRNNFINQQISLPRDPSL